MLITFSIVDIIYLVYQRKAPENRSCAQSPQKSWYWLPNNLLFPIVHQQAIHSRYEWSRGTWCPVDLEVATSYWGNMHREHKRPNTEQADTAGRREHRTRNLCNE